MGKSKGDGATLKHLRYQKQNGGNLPLPIMIEVQVIATGRMGTPKSVLITTEHLRYLFNCGEGTQRLAMEHKMKVSRIGNIFFTHRNWLNIGGLLGMCLSLEGTCNVPSITIHGPPNVEKFVTMSRGFAQLHKIELNKHEVDCNYFEDSNMRVEYIPLLPKIQESNTDEPAHKKFKPNEENMAVVYVCKPHPKPRTLSLEKCVDLDVPRGAHIRELKAGKEITLDDGRVINPDDVLEPQTPNRSIVIIECPSTDYLPALENNLTLHNLSNDGEGVEVVVHLTSSDIMKDPIYKNWMHCLGASVKHMFVNEDGSDVAFCKTYYNQAVLNQLHPEVFPLLHQQQRNTQEAGSIHLEGNCVKGQANLRYLYRGRTEEERTFSTDMCYTINNQSYIEESMAFTDYTEELQALKAEQQQIQISDDTGSYPEILFLGTGSSIPNKARNVTCIFVRTSKDTCIILDCGENSYGQLLRFYGPERTAEIMKDLKAVFVSHLHADHHMGLLGLLLGREELIGSDAEPLLVLAPGPMGKWLLSIDHNIQPISHMYKMVSLESLYKFNLSSIPHEGIAQEEEANVNVCEYLNLREFDPIRVKHAQFPHGIVLTTQDGYKLVFSGDTRPCKNLIEAGKDCDMLIHEASMEDDLAEDAVRKKHSTTSEAIEVGQKMKAKFTLLTHFSQRYAKIPMFNDKFHDTVGIAFDNMMVTPKLTTYLHGLLPTLKQVFAEDYAEMEDKRLHRQMRRQRDNSKKINTVNATKQNQQRSIAS